MPKASSRSSSESSGEFSSMCRQQRNIAEKQRRDKLNSYINELATIIPFVAHSSKRLDKTSILRLAAAHIRMHKNVIKSQRKNSSIQSWRPSFIGVEHLKDLLEDVEGFLFIASNVGKIIFMSSSVERFLGHQNIDMMGHSFLNFVHPTDVDMVETHLLNMSEAIDKGESTARCSFHCRIREKSQPRSEVVSYQVFKVTGQIAYQHGCDDYGSEESSSSRALLKGFVQLVHSSPFSQVSLRNSISDEYVTYHDILGKIIQVDQNISTITGHLPEEVVGRSAYDFIIPEDLVITSFAQKLMLSSSNGRGLVVYRLRTVTGSSIFLMSSGYLHFDSDKGQISHFVCINRLLSKEVGTEKLKKFQLRYFPHSAKEICPSATPSPSLSQSSALENVTRESGITVFIDVTPPLSPHSLETPSPSSTIGDASCVQIFEISDTPSNGDSEAIAFNPKNYASCSELSNGSSYLSQASESDGSAVMEETLSFSDLFDPCIYSQKPIHKST